MLKHVVSDETVASARMLRNIFHSVNDNGVIDVFKKYSTKELIPSIYAFSRLQAASAKYDQLHAKNEVASMSYDDQLLLEELNYYAPFASAAYGWKMDLATAGRFHGGDLQALVRMTRIEPEDVVHVVWESKANQTVSSSFTSKTTWLRIVRKSIQCLTC